MVLVYLFFSQFDSVNYIHIMVQPRPLEHFPPHKTESLYLLNNSPFSLPFSPWQILSVQIQLSISMG